MLILVVDDHPLYRDALVRLMPQIFAEASVLQAPDLHSARACLASAPPVNLVLLDLDLPDSHGAAALIALRKTGPALRIVIVSATEDAAEARLCLAEGACGYIPKSARTDVLAAALRLVNEGGTYLPPLLLEAPAVGPASMVSLPRPTARECEILELVCAGLSNKAIARTLQIAEPTVRAHLSSAFRTLGVINRTQAARVALERGLVRSG